MTLSAPANSHLTSNAKDSTQLMAILVSVISHLMSGAAGYSHLMTISAPANSHLTSNATDSTQLMAILVSVISHLMSGAAGYSHLMTIPAPAMVIWRVTQRINYSADGYSYIGY